MEKKLSLKVLLVVMVKSLYMILLHLRGPVANDTNTQLTADQIVSLLTDRALQLASGTTVDGQTISYRKLNCTLEQID